MFLATSIVIAGTPDGNTVWSLEIKTSHYYFLLSLINVFTNLNSCFAETLDLNLLLFIKIKFFTDIVWVTICTL